MDQAANNHGSWVERVSTAKPLASVHTRYRPNGLPASTALAEEKLHFDAFGRPTQMRLADNHVIVLGYTGDRVRRRFLQVGTARDPVTGAIAETQFWTRERYDRQGRLHQLAESSGAGNVELNTNYTYDIGNRLKSVSTCPVATAPCPTGLAQTRNFTYDNRGFLTSETHPEKGPSGNGTVTYPEYDALGHATRRVDGGFDLTFAYDRAERLFEVKETGGAQRVMKSFTYGGHLPAGTPSNGKIETATRRNYPLIGGSPFEVIVTETYTYGGKGGRVSQRSTLIYDHGLNQFAYTQSWAHDDLGNPTSLGYPQCTSVPPPADNGCFSQGGAVPRTITNTYTRGWLTGIPGYLSSITYHNNLQMNVLTHPNGVTVTYAKDPNQMQRPASIATSAGWSTGSYAYDGSGNIVRIGPLLSGSWYLYDGVSRMVQSSTRTGLAGGGGTAKQNVSFDPFGNIQSITNDGTVRSTPTSGSTNRLTGAVVYDPAGNLTSWNGNTYEYGPFGEMSAYRSGTESWLYLYTVDEERVRAYDLARSIGYFSIRDLDGRLLREYCSNSWTTPKDYVYRSDGRLVSSIDGTTVRHLHVDHLGSVRQITNSSGASVEYHVFYPFGEEATATGTEQMKFTGHERDLANPAGTADDLDYMHARFANPQLGRFLGVDPIIQQDRAASGPQLWNRYSYAANNPLMNVDPTGRVIVALGDSSAQKMKVLAVFKQALKEAGMGALAKLLQLEDKDGVSLITAGELDLSLSSNSTAQLIGAAMKTKDTITVELTTKGVGSFGGARTDSAGTLRDPLLIRIELNPATIARQVFPGVIESGPNTGMQVGLGTSVATALVHELGHAYGYFAEGMIRFPVVGQTNATALRFENLHRQYMASGPLPVLRRLEH